MWDFIHLFIRGFMSRVSARFLQKFWVNETPTGTVNGSNTAFTLSQTPSEDEAIFLSVNGLNQELTTDYSVSGTTITFVTAPATASKVRVSYVRKNGE